MIRRHMTVYGQVQGVGFRYQAQRAAELFGCTGWVRNEWDGSVVMELQGSGAQIARVLFTIKRNHFIRIERIESEDTALIPDERRFRIIGY